jgi:hypothetical protein
MVRKSKAKPTAKWQYLGETDPAQFIWSNKTHRSASEAFRDAEYATAIQRPKSEWRDFIEFTSGFVVMLPMIVFALYIFYLVAVATN